MTTTTLKPELALPKGPVLRLLLRCITTIAGLSMVVKGVGFLRDAAAASVFGTSDAMDAYILALSVPTLLAGLLAEAMPTALIPAYARAKNAFGEESAAKVVANAIFFQATTAAGICLLLLLVSQPLVGLLAGDFGAEKTTLSRNLFMLLLVFSVLLSTSHAVTAALQAEKRFALAALSPAIIPAVCIALLFALHESIGVYSLAVGLVAGAFLHLCVLTGGAVTQFGSACLLPRFRGRENGKFLGDSLLLLLGSAIFGGCVMIDISVASRLEAGTVATLGYAEKVLGIVLSLAGVALGQSLLPYLSDLSAQGDLSGLRRMGFRISGLVLAATLPLVLALWCAAVPVTQVLFQRGEFGAEETARVADALRWGSLQFPAAALGIVASRMVISTGGVRYMCLVSAVALAANLVLDLTLAPVFGLAGILVATALVHAISAGLLFLKIPKP